MARYEFPELLYVKIENQGEEDQYFYAIDDVDGHAEVGETIKVARYRLDEVADVEVKHNARKSR